MDKAAMYKLTYGLFVLTAKDGIKDNGCIINTVMQVTTTPNRMIIVVNKQNYTHDMIQKTKAFNVSCLSEDVTFDVFRHFGFQSGRDRAEEMWIRCRTERIRVQKMGLCTYRR